MKLYGIKTCDNCREAIKDLNAAGIDFEYIDLRKDGISAAVLAAAFDAVGAALLNKSSTAWRGLNESERGEAPASLLLKHPTVIKRPLIDNGGVFTVGWKADVKEKYLR